LKQVGSLTPPLAEEREQYFAAHERYSGYRDAARDATEAVAWEIALDDLRPVRSLRLTEIDGAALGFWEASWRVYPSPHLQGNFPWPRIMRQIHTTPRRLDLAIWGNDILCGLCAGMSARSKRHVSIRFLESFHGPNPLRGLIAAISVDFAEAYAQILGARSLKLLDPAAGALPQYERLGFRLVRRGRVAPCCEREV
jgi:hypothetical protein